MERLFNTQEKDTNGTPVVRFRDITKDNNTYFYCSPLPIHAFSVDYNFLRESHKHNFYELIWIEGGQGIHKINHKEYRVKANSLFFLAPNTIHSFNSSKRISGFYLAFTQNFIFHIPQKIREAIDSCTQGSIKDFLFCNISNSNIIRRDLNMIKEEYDFFKSTESNSLYYTATLISLLFMDIIRFGDWNNMEDCPLHDISYKKYEEFISLVERNYKKEHRIKFYIEEMHISKSSLTASTKLYSQLPPVRIINERILLEAKTLILNGDKNIKEIATLLNFEDASNFAKFFKRMTNQSIADYKIKNRINVSKSDQ